MKYVQDGKGMESIAKDIEAAVRSMPAEYLYLPPMPESGRAGYVAILRDIRAVSRTKVFTSAIQERIRAPEAPAGYRLARLSDPLKYSLSQRFAWLFSRVGLATAYEDERDFFAQAAADSFRKLGEVYVG